MKLRAAREKSGKTQAQVAKETEIAERAYQNYETGERTPRADVAIAIADTLGVKSYKQFKELFKE